MAGLAAAGPAASLAEAASAAVPAAAAASTAGNATGLSQSGNTFTVTSTSGAKVRVVVARADVFRLWLSPDGAFTNDPAGSDLAPTTDFGPVSTGYTDAGSYYKITTGSVSIRVNKAPLQFSVYRADDSTLVWQETQPTSWTGSQTTQYLARGADEQFYGTGLRLGSGRCAARPYPSRSTTSGGRTTTPAPRPSTCRPTTTASCATPGPRARTPSTPPAP